MNSLPEDASFDQLVDTLIESREVSSDELTDQLRDLLRGFLKEKFEAMMKGERLAFLDEEEEDSDNKGNGYYQRNLKTRYGEIEDLDVPRDRKGNFQPALLAPYQRQEEWLEEMIIGLYTRGIIWRNSTETPTPPQP